MSQPDEGDGSIAAAEPAGPVAVDEAAVENGTARVVGDSPAEGGERREMPAPPYTGDPRVDEAVRALAGLAEQPPTEHVAGYEAAHAGLQDTLADVDKRAEGEEDDAR